MATDYQSVWESMNSLEQVSAKILSARDILDASRNSLERHEYSRAESLIVAAQEFLEYYLREFDDKFKVAWNETVVKSKDDGFYWDTDPKNNLIDFTVNTSFNHDCMDSSPWLDWQEGFTTSTKKTWTLPVEHIETENGGEEYFVTLPDDLLEQTGWDEGTELVWEDNGNGSYTLKKP